MSTLAVPSAAWPVREQVSAPSVLLLAVELSGLLRAIHANPTTAVAARAARLAGLAVEFEVFAASDHRDADQAAICAGIARTAAGKLAGRWSS